MSHRCSTLITRGLGVFSQLIEAISLHCFDLGETIAILIKLSVRVSEFFELVAAFAKLTGDKKLVDYCVDRFKNVIVPGQIEPDGSQQQELRRTKPYGYCLFNLEALATVCQILSEGGENLWAFQTADGRGVRKAIEYMYPFLKDKKTWIKPPDVMYYEYWPMRQEALLFGGLAYQQASYLDLWKTLPADSDVDEIIRNFFIRQPVLWVA